MPEVNGYDFPNDEICGDPNCWCAESRSVTNSSKESAVSTANSSLIGQRGTTSNAFINDLPDGTILEVVGPGEVEVLDVLVGDEPLPSVAAAPVSLKPGDRINTKYGPATVLRLTNRLSAAGAGLEDGDILYLADGTNVARVAQREEVSAL